MGNGSATVFTFPWATTSASVINVYLVNSSGVQTLLAPTAYTITLNAIGAGQLWPVGGTVTYPLVGSPIASGTQLIVQRAVPYSQPTNVANQTAYPLSVQTALDTLCFEIQQNASRTGQMRGTWVSGVQYYFGDVIQDGVNGASTSNYYMCAIANVSGTWATDLAAGDWALVINIQNINATIGAFLPLAGGTILGNLTVNGSTSIGTNLTVTGTSTLTGNVTVPTQVSSDNSTKAASTAMVQAAIAASVANPTVISPQGRLTLVSGTPVMVTDQTAVTAIYYTPYIGSIIPVYNGTSFVNGMFTELTLTLNTSNHLSGHVYDVFVFSNSGTLTIATGPSWTNTTTRSAAVSQLQGIWTNTAIITLINNATTYSNIPTNRATYVGSFYATANGQTGVAFHPAAAASGTNNFIALWNAYNQIYTTAECQDNTATWTYGTATWRQAALSGSTRITFLDGLRQSTIEGRYTCCVNTLGSNSAIGIGLNSISSPYALAAITGGTNVAQQPVVFLDSYPLLGLNYMQALEYADNPTTFGGSANVFAMQTQNLCLTNWRW